MDILNKTFLWLKNYLFPSACLLCNKSLINAFEIRYGLCQHCLVLINPRQGLKCNVCGIPLISEIHTCLACRSTKRSYDRLWVIFPYTGKYRKLLSAYKFNKNIALADFFAEKILDVINDNPILKDAVIVPVPPRPGKIKTLGWDQVEYLVKRLERISKDKKICRCLKRHKSKIQKQLTRKERMENLKGRIYSKGSTPQIALIIDDVITTGSTIEVCADVLKAAGTKEVYGLCLFYD